MNQIKTPWRDPDYKGKLKKTPTLPCQPGYIPPTVEEQKEVVYTALADGDIDIDLFNKMILTCK